MENGSMKRLAWLVVSVLMFGWPTGQCAPGHGRTATPVAGAQVASVAYGLQFNRWLDEQFSAYLDFSPMTKTRLGDKSDYDLLDDVSPQGQDRQLAWRQRSVSTMIADFDRDRLDAEGKLSWDLWLYLLSREQAGQQFRHHNYIFGRRGPHTSLPNNLINYHKVDDVADMLAYIARLRASGVYLDAYLLRARESAARGIRAPYFDYEIAISQIHRVTTGEPFSDVGTSALWADITKKIAALGTAEKISAAQKDELNHAARAALLETVQPAYQRIVAWLEADSINVPRQASGVWALPDGGEFYQHSLLSRTTLPLTAQEIHKIGLAEVERIQKEMREIKQKVGFSGTLAEFFTYSRESPGFYFPNTDAGRAGYLDLANAYLTAMNAKLPEYFGILPEAPLQVRRVEAFREQAGAAAHYMRGTIDGARPGVFYVHLSDMSAASNYRLEDLAYHEGLPGHHMQISIQQELTGVPRFRTHHGYTAYSEGWGLYAELLAKDMGFYTEPMNDFGRLSGEIWRAIRLVVDTGIHAMKWTEAEAVRYAMNNSARPATSVRSEIRRYFNSPGQATAYKIGMLKILELREKAQKVLGDQFSFREFHDVVLGSGALPLPLLEAKVGNWLDTAAKERINEAQE